MMETDDTKPSEPTAKRKVTADRTTAPELSADATASETGKPGTTVPDETVLDDAETDAAVGDIIQDEGDVALAAQDAIAESTVAPETSRFARFKTAWKAWWANPKKRWGSVAGIVILLLVMFALPVTRYNILGIALKAPVTVQVTDSKTGAPVSGATVRLAGKTAETQANGKVSFRTNLGSGSLVVTKKYYTSSKQGTLIGFSGNQFKTTLVATGRQVSIKLVNKLTGKPLSGATIDASGAKAKTNAAGTADVVLASGATTAIASISDSGYNTTKVTIDTTADVTKNTFSMTPSGKLYFLSNLSGSLDVVKTDLDGSNRQTVLAGTGSEDRNSTSLLASRDWKYLALLSKRSGTNASVYLIDTTNGDKLTTIDQGDADYNLVGWSGDRFIYQVTRHAVSDWQYNQQALKSLDATSGQTLLLDQTQGSGTSPNDYIKQQFASAYIIGKQVVYGKNWYASYGNAQLASKQAELDTISADGSSHATIKQFGLATPGQNSYIGINTTLYEPAGLYIQFYDGTKNTYYDYSEGKVAVDTTLTDTSFYQTPYPTYLLSPSGDATFWADQRDGKNTLFVGDADGKNQKQIATLGSYTTYGWYTDSYLLVSKNSSELYIEPASGGMPYKITDYYKPAINYNGYGGGYGGL